MKAFMDEDFLLDSEVAKILYHNYAEKMPIVDYHCHISPREIAEDIHFENITQLWLGGDHYKWRLMRANGVKEEYITGNASDREKFQKWAETLEKAIGNPLYHWSHLELQRYFDYHGVLNGDTAEEVWNLCNNRLKDPDMTARGLILQSNVTHLCTTDDPADSLEWHKSLRDDETFHVEVLPAWRPDAAMSISAPGFAEYMKKLGEVSGLKIESFKDLQTALNIRMEFFDSMGCRISDHSLDYVMYETASETEVEQIFEKALHGLAVTYKEELKYKTAFLLEVGKEYKKLGWSMQLHYGVKRDNNTKLYQSYGANVGADCINTHTPSSQLADLLDAMDKSGALPKTILYSLNPSDNVAVNTVIGCFQGDECRGKLQQGSAWWFNDNKYGITEQLTALASQGLLGNFIGMLTDSRSFISYTRHEYFRRILCSFIGKWVENGEYPWDEHVLGQKVLGRMVQDISYNNAMEYFGFNRK